MLKIDLLTFCPSTFKIEGLSSSSHCQRRDLGLLNFRSNNSGRKGQTLWNNWNLKSALVLLASARHGLQLVLTSCDKSGGPQEGNPTQSGLQAVEFSSLAKVQQLPFPRVQLIFSLKIHPKINFRTSKSSRNQFKGCSLPSLHGIRAFVSTLISVAVSVHSPDESEQIRTSQNVLGRSTLRGFSLPCEGI